MTRVLFSESNPMTEVGGGYPLVLCALQEWRASDREGGGRCRLACLAGMTREILCDIEIHMFGHDIRECLCPCSVVKIKEK